MAGRGNPNWQKGKSGNISGRPKEFGELRELARKYTREAVETLVDVMQNGQQKDRAFAADKLLDRGWGKPGQSVELSGKDGGPLQAILNIVQQDSKK